MTTGTLISYGNKLSREDLAHIPTPPATATHRPIPHHEIYPSADRDAGFPPLSV